MSHDRGTHRTFGRSRFWAIATFLVLVLGAPLVTQAAFRGVLLSGTPIRLEITPSIGATAVTLTSIDRRGRFDEVIDLTASWDPMNPTTFFAFQLKPDITRLIVTVNSALNSSTRLRILEGDVPLVDAHVVGDETMVFNVSRP